MAGDRLMEQENGQTGCNTYLNMGTPSTPPPCLWHCMFHLPPACLPPAFLLLPASSMPLCHATGHEQTTMGMPALACTLPCTPPSACHTLPAGKARQDRNMPRQKHTMHASHHLPAPYNTPLPALPASLSSPQLKGSRTVRGWSLPFCLSFVPHPVGPHTHCGCACAFLYTTCIHGTTPLPMLAGMGPDAFDLHPPLPIQVSDSVCVYSNKHSKHVCDIFSTHSIACVTFQPAV